MRYNRAFTLIELLVVVAIIVALLAILMPAMSKATETAQLAVCASQLNQWGAIHLNFASDHFGNLPVSGKWPNTSTDAHLIILNYRPGTDEAFGTTYQTLAGYGLNGGLLRCPSSDMIERREAAYLGAGYTWHKTLPTMLQHYNAAADTATWIVIEEYGLLTNMTTDPAINHMTRFLPARTLRDDRSSQRLMQADMFYWHGWQAEWYTNHAAADGMAKYQNLLKLDGSVMTLTEADYDRDSLVHDRYTQLSWGVSNTEAAVHHFYEGSPKD